LFDARELHARGSIGRVGCSTVAKVHRRPVAEIGTGASIGYILSVDRFVNAIAMPIVG
jgi:hypothetical protein